MKEETIRLNGKVFDQRNLIDLKSDINKGWQNDIYYFLECWFNDSSVIITRTSGSTGEPKGIRLAKQAMRNSAKMTNAFFGLTESKTALLCLPALYIAGKMMLVRAIVGGFNLIPVEPKANPFENVNSEIDFTAITPFQLNASAETLKKFPLKNIIVGGGHVNKKLEEISTEIPANLYETYGMTETASHIALRRFNGEKSEYFTILDGVSIRQDERDCLVISAPHLTDEELITNDIIELNTDKSFKWLGRADSVINSGGVKIFPEQVEKKLENYIPFNFYVIGLPDENLGTKVVLVIENNVNINFNNIFETVLGKYEIPKEVFYTEKFQYSVSNKILKKETLEHILKVQKH